MGCSIPSVVLPYNLGSGLSIWIQQLDAAMPPFEQFRYCFARLSLVGKKITPIYQIKYLFEPSISAEKQKWYNLHSMTFTDLTP